MLSDGHMLNGGGALPTPDMDVTERTRRLRELIETRIPEHRAQLEASHPNLENVAQYCESNYFNAHPNAKRAAFEETRKYALQSLASVAYQVNTLASGLLEMLDLQMEKVATMGTQVDGIKMSVNINKEKQARREIGVLTTTRSVPKVPKIIAPAVMEPKNRYQRVPIDYSVLDGVGHGVRQKTGNGHSVQAAPIVARSASSASGQSSGVYGAMHGSSNYSNQQNYERLANINNTLSRSSMRSAMSSGGGEYRVPGAVPPTVSVDYRVPQVPDYRTGPVVSQMSSDYRVPTKIGGDPRYSAATPLGNGSGNYGIYAQHQQDYSDYGSNARDYGSQRSTDYAGSQASTYVPGGGSSSGAVSPTFPLPPPSLMHQGSSSGGTYRALFGDRFGPPREALLDDDDPMPPPPPPAGSQFFDAVSDPQAPPNYIERAMVIYDYDAEKPDELTLRSNRVVYVLCKNDDGWFEGVMDGVTGLFPGNYVQPI